MTCGNFFKSDVGMRWGRKDLLSSRLQIAPCPLYWNRHFLDHDCLHPFRRSLQYLECLFIRLIREAITRHSAIPIQPQEHSFQYKRR